MDPNQRDNSSRSSPEEADQVFEVALSLVPAAEAFARRRQLSSDTAHEMMMEAAKRVVESQASARYGARESIKNLPAYLFSVGRNLMLGELKRKKDEVQIDDDQDLAANYTESIENRILVSEIVQRMNPKVRAIFRYRTLGYGYDEIARKFKEMGVKATGGSLRSELSKATKRITEELEESGINT
jgi:DNA-directed RNA polymerase specialized sigma24 family protein